MSKDLRRLCIACSVVAGLVVPVGAQQAPQMGGRAIFVRYCASCHGAQGKGDGPLADAMRVRPADLTQIAKRNGGEFPRDRVAKTIDGRSPVKGHGGGDMPVWGDAFAQSAEGTATVEERIQQLVRHLQSIQVP